MDKNYFSKIRILDGGMGQHLLAKGLKPKGSLWSGTALIDKRHHQLIVDAHLDFIKSGAEVIITNNFSVRRARMKQNNVEEYTGRAITQQTLQLFLDRLPYYRDEKLREGVYTAPDINYSADYIVLPKPPVASITHVKYYANDNTASTFAASNYFSDVDSTQARVVLKNGDPVGVFANGEAYLGFNSPSRKQELYSKTADQTYINIRIIVCRNSLQGYSIGCLHVG